MTQNTKNTQGMNAKSFIDVPGLHNDKFYENFNNKSRFDILKNNDKYGTIILFPDENPQEKIKDLFGLLLNNGTININYYDMYNTFSLCDTKDGFFVFKTIVDSIREKIERMSEAVKNGIDINMYDQIWKTFVIFSENMYELLKNHQPFMINKKIKNSSVNNSIFDIIRLAIFYDKIFGGDKIKNIKNITKSIQNIHAGNIDLVLTLVQSLRFLSTVKEYISFDSNAVRDNIKTIFNDNEIINILFKRINNLVLNPLHSTEGHVFDTEKIKIKNNNMIHKLMSYLISYVDSDKLIMFHRKYMQSRIININKFDHNTEYLMIEKLLKKVSGVDCQSMVNCITDILNSKKAISIIKNMKVGIKSEKYKKLESINCSVLFPLVITKKNWIIHNNINIEPELPLELDCYMNIILKSYNSIFESKYIIEWQYTMGYMIIEGCFKYKSVTIKCNMMQGIILFYFNEHKTMSLSQIANKLNINETFVESLLDPMLDNNIINGIDSYKSKEYFVNHENFYGPNFIDIHQKFIDSYQVNNDD